MARKPGIQSIPTLMIFQAGVRRWQSMGVQSLNVLKQELTE